MELTFPFLNMAINDLLRFVESYKIADYIDVQKKNDANTARHFNPYLEMYDSALANFENELLQVIETTDQKTINSYFNTLAQDIRYIKEKISLENVTAIVNKFNKDSLRRFEKEIFEKTEEYFQSDNRKLKHLEEYKGPSQSHFLILYNGGKAKQTNYNFYCAEQKLRYIDPSYIPEIYEFIGELASKFFGITSKFGKDWARGKIKSRQAQFIKPILFVEGNQDISYISRAAVLLNKEELLEKIDMRQRGSCHKLDSLWDIYKNDNWETVPQKKIFLYDCDTGRADEDNGWNFRRMIPAINGHPIKRGIENLFKEDILRKAANHKPALVDIVVSSGVKRGETFAKTDFTIDKQEKKNLCDWICENGDSEAFKDFEVIFDIIIKIIN